MPLQYGWTQVIGMGDNIGGFPLFQFFHVILPGYAIPLRGLFCVVFHCFVLQISVGCFAVCYIVLDCFSVPGSSSPVSRTTEPLENQGVPLFCVRKYPNRTQTSPNDHMFSMKACILFADSRRMVSVT